MSNPTWTREKPTVAGWYWWRYAGEPAVVRVIHSMYGLVIEGHVGLVQNMNAHWLGPITPDSFQQGRVAGLREAVPLACKYCNDRTKWTPMSNSGYHVCNMPEPDFVRCQAIKIHAALAQQAQDEKGVGDGHS